jgi:oligopeptide transport system substrate-binding protein
LDEPREPGLQAAGEVDWLEGMVASLSRRRAGFSSLMGLALLIGANGCGRTPEDSRAGSEPTPADSSASSTRAEGTPVRGGTLRIGNGDEPQDLDPQVVTGVPESRILESLIEGLLAPDPHDLHPVPGLAESWEISPDGLVYTFHLRANARWSNGDPVTADDFIASYRRMLTPALAAPNAFQLWYVTGAEEYNKGRLTDFSRVGFRAPDPRTFQVTLRHPTPFLLKLIATNFTWDPVPVRVIAQYGPIDQQSTPWTRAGHFVGTGPFRLKEWRSNQRIVVERNPHYWDAEHVRLDGIEFLPVQDAATEERMFRAGQMDVTETMPISKVETYRRERPQDLHIDPHAAVYFYRCNTTRPPLDDARVRRALALAVDRESLVRNVTRSGQRPAYAVSYPDNSGYTARAHLTGGVEEARRLLAEAGHPGGRGLAPIHLLYNTQEGHRAIAEAIQAMWRKNLGVEVELENQEWKVFLQTVHSQAYQMARAGWTADFTDPHVFLEIWVTGNGNNDTGWSNAEYDRLAAAALAAGTQAERYACYQKMDAILVDECPVIPLYYYTHAYAMSPRVHGYWNTIIDEHPWKYVWLTPP